MSAAAYADRAVYEIVERGVLFRRDFTRLAERWQLERLARAVDDAV